MHIFCKTEKCHLKSILHLRKISGKDVLLEKSGTAVQTFNFKKLILSYTVLSLFCVYFSVSRQGLNLNLKFCNRVQHDLQKVKIARVIFKRHLQIVQNRCPFSQDIYICAPAFQALY
jgi:hypothetical protein